MEKSILDVYVLQEPWRKIINSARQRIHKSDLSMPSSLYPHLPTCPTFLTTPVIDPIICLCSSCCCVWNVPFTDFLVGWCPSPLSKLRLNMSWKITINTPRDTTVVEQVGFRIAHSLGESAPWGSMGCASKRVWERTCNRVWALMECLEEDLRKHVWL